MLPNGLAYLCGRIHPDSENMLARGFIYLRNRAEIRVDPNDPGIKCLKPGRRRFVIVMNGRIWAVYGRPRIKLLRYLARENPVVTEELLLLYRPMYLCLMTFS